MPIVAQDCFLSLTTSERWEQIYLALGGESECFLEAPFLEQQRMILALLGSEECIYSSQDFWRAWAAVLGIECVGDEQDAQKRIYTYYYDQGATEGMVDPACFEGLGPDGGLQMLFVGVSGSSELLPAPENLVASGNGDGTFDASWDAVDGATGYEYQIGNGPWVDAGNVTELTGESIL